MNSALLSEIKTTGDLPQHVAIIMDGNGRWAKDRMLPRSLGHRAGMKSVRESVEGCIEAGVEILTLFAFSQENWSRPDSEIGALMAVLVEFINRELKDLKRNGVEVSALGDLDRLGPKSRAAVDKLVRETAGGSNLNLNLCISYSSRFELARAAKLLAQEVADGVLRPEDIDEAAVENRLYTARWPDPDLLIRTSGEQRISNFLLWQLAYTEIYVTPVLWPDFTRTDLFEAIADFQRRERRYGRVPT
ncbi:MAG: isoprenyl transferase [Gemmatimonadetes bacterium]|nr:isoprenyl transferase [Gemmatimonadota bacterium]MCZ6761345.1 isoprenyl transferase [Gemmatimonadota bacterium]